MSQRILWCDGHYIPADGCRLCAQRVIVYPCYINSKKTVAQGRKIPLSKGKPAEGGRRYGKRERKEGDGWSQGRGGKEE